MKKYLSIFMMLCTMIPLISCSRKPLYKSKPLEPVSERPEPGSEAWIGKLQYNDKYKLAYGCFNDDKDLVIRVKVTDRNVMAKIFSAGFTISIDTTAKKNPQFAIKYPLPQGMQNMQQPEERNMNDAGRNRPGKPDEKMKNRFKMALNQIEIHGFSDEAVKKATVNSRNGDGITAWIFNDSAMNMYYELKIPLGEIASREYLSKNCISVGFESGKMAMPSFAPGRQGRPGGGMRPSGEISGGEMSGSGRPGGGRPGERGEMQPRIASSETLTTPINIWMKRIELQQPTR